MRTKTDYTKRCQRELGAGYLVLYRRGKSLASKKSVTVRCMSKPVQWCLSWNKSTMGMGEDNKPGELDGWRENVGRDLLYERQGVGPSYHTGWVANNI